MALDTLPPSSPESERGLCGAIVIAGGETLERCLDVGLTADDFYERENSCVWIAANKLHDKRKAIDVVTLAEQIEQDRTWPQDGGLNVYLTSLARATPTYFNAAEYAKIVKDKSLRRSLIHAAGVIAQIGYSESDDIETSIDKAEAALKRTKDKAPTVGRDPNPNDIIDRMEGLKASGVPTRFPALNNMSAGMVRGHLWVIGGFSSTGKTAVMVNLLEDVMRAGGSAMVASTEMSQEQYMLRALSMTSNVPQRTIRHGGMNLEQAGDYATAKAFWKTGRVRVYDDLYSVTRIRRMAKKVREQMGDLDVLFVDFLQNLNETGDEVKDARISAIQLQQIAKDLNCCVVALSQISNAQAMQQQETGAMGNYYAFKGSGAIKDAADLAIMLDRDRVNAPEVLWFNVVKNRHDTLGRFAGQFHLESGRIEQMADLDMMNADPNSGRRSKRKREDDE